MAPFDRAFYLTLGVGVGGLGDFDDGRRYAATKPWTNDAVHAKQQFWDAMSAQRSDQWPGSEARMLVDYVRVYAL